MIDGKDASAERSPIRTGVRTRATADRLPNLLLAGIGKAGTTSLFWHLSQHPDICASRVKEPRYFLALSENDEDAEGVPAPLETYTALFDRCGSRRYAMEATPHYFHGGARLIDGLKRTLPDPRIGGVEPGGQALGVRSPRRQEHCRARAADREAPPLPPVVYLVQFAEHRFAPRRSIGG